MWKIESRSKYIFAKCFLSLFGWIRAGWVKSFLKRAENIVLFHEDIYAWRANLLREMGAKIGDDCKFYSIQVDSEPVLLEIGDHVAVADGARFITHDGGLWIFWEDHPEIDNYGKITIGNNVFIGMDAIILPNSTIGDNCVIGAGAVVRGKIAENSVVMGNPARVIMKTSLYKKLIMCSKHTLPTALMPKDKKGQMERNRLIAEAFSLGESGKNEA